jgi:hypothetical protein
MNTPNPKYVTGVGKPHIRVTDIHIKAHAPDPAQGDPLAATVTYIEAESTLMSDGSVREFRSLPAQTFTVRASEMPQQRWLVNPDTDEDIAPTTVQAIYGHIFAALRHHQRLRDAAEAPAPEPQPE